MHKKINLVYIVSDIEMALTYEWVVEKLDHSRFDLSFILINPQKNTQLHRFLNANKIPNHFVPFAKKSDLPNAIIRTTSLLIKIKPDVTHCHLFNACMIGLISSYICGVKKRIYTRHYSTLHFEYFPHAVKYDRFFNILATHIISISSATYKVLVEKEGVSAKKIHSIPHGFDLYKFQNPNPEEVSLLRSKYNPNGRFPVIGVISRYIKLKGIQYTIDAFEKLLEKYPKALLLLANANGDYKSVLNESLAKLPANSFIEIEFEKNLYAFYQLMNVFVHVPINSDIEAFGQTYVESMAAGIPAVFTKSGIGNELCVHGENCLVVEYENSQQIYDAMLRYLEDDAFAKKVADKAKGSVDPFKLELFIEKLSELYAS